MANHSVSIVAWVDRYETSEVDPDDSWSRASTAADYNIEGIQLTDKYGDFIIDFDLKPGVYYYLVYADYGTGDSFGHDNNQLEYVDLFTTREKAEACQTALLSSDHVERYSAGYYRENGQGVSVSKPWEGYFDHLNGIHIAEVTLV
jgi:hypothetical protein